VTDFEHVAVLLTGVPEGLYPEGQKYSAKELATSVFLEAAVSVHFVALALVYPEGHVPSIILSQAELPDKV
jgi:hypothetical protein